MPFTRAADKNDAKRVISLATNKLYQIQISVQSQYLENQSDPTKQTYSFAYTVRIANSGNVPAQLISRHWIIQDDNQEQIEIKGLGVVGHQPLLQPNEAFEYSSGSQLKTPSGSMKGSYFFVAEDGTRFDAQIPEFVLTVPRVLH
jgi:ApaG protein